MLTMSTADSCSPTIKAIGVRIAGVLVQRHFIAEQMRVDAVGSGLKKIVVASSAAAPEPANAVPPIVSQRRLHARRSWQFGIHALLLAVRSRGLQTPTRRAQELFPLEHQAQDIQLQVLTYDTSHEQAADTAIAHILRAAQVAS